MKIEWKSCLKVVLSAFLLYLCVYYWPSVANVVGAVFSAAAPLLVGCVIAYAINILMSFYERHYAPNSTSPKVIKSRRPVCMVLAFLTLILVVVLLFALVIPELGSCVQLLLAELPGTIESLVATLDKTEILSDDMVAWLNGIDWQSKIQQVIQVLTSGVGNMMGNVVSAVSSIFSGIVTAFLGIIFSIYLLLGKEKLGGQATRLMKRYMKESWHNKLTHVLSVLNNCFHKYVVGQCTEAVILGALCTIGMTILRLPYATMIGAVIAFTALIPVAGAYIGAGVGAFMIFTVSPMKALIFLIFIVVLQQLEGNLIYPRVVGSSLGLPAIWVLSAVTIGGGIMGIAGMLLGVPLAATVYQLLREEVNKLPAKGVEPNENHPSEH